MFGGVRRLQRRHGSPGAGADGAQDARGTIVPVEEGGFITELAREVLRGAELDDLQSLFADEMRVSNSPMGCPTEVSPVLIPVNPKTWLDWALEHQVAKAAAGRRSSGKQSSAVHVGQLSIWKDFRDK